ncbi:MAG: ribosome biogenesis GTPase Der [Casimicrobiaceae bacterium]|nr:ribosome biogenesis GTPase Der [Casimicrobiaceae bacterium]MDW8312400.1 ribosome biogenesis GTPase Der [Burkholderiales bacterium]
MLPSIALVGRPNVGKSTLFNRLTRSRAALVADVPGVTRDRQYGRGQLGERRFVVIDTGGFEPVAKDGILREMARQTLAAIDEADLVIFVVDGREGLTAQDHSIADVLRRRQRPVLVAVNKTEGLVPEQAVAEFHELGLGEPYAISAAHGDRVSALIEHALERLAPPAVEADRCESSAETLEAQSEPKRCALAVVGHPNVGKSTLINALLGEARVIAFDEPGTTRDAIRIDWSWQGRPYVLIDTAGVRKRSKVSDPLERFSAIKTLQAIDEAQVVVFVLDAEHGVSDQDVQLAAYIQESGRGLVVALNKWDRLDRAAREHLKQDYARKLYFLDYAEAIPISAQERMGLDDLMRAVEHAHAASFARLPTPKLTRAIQAAVMRQQPPRAGLVRPKLRYAHQGGSNPPTVVIHGTALDRLPATYLRYLEGFLRSSFGLRGAPLRLELRTGHNPYAPTARVRSGRSSARR